MTQEDIKKRNEALVEELFSLINYMSNDADLAKLIQDKVARTHRTNTQSLFGMLKVVIEEYAESGSADGRNEQSLEWAKMVTAASEKKFMKKRGFGFI